MLNRIILAGRITKDPELRSTNSGKPVCPFTLAVDRDYKPMGAQRETDFIDCVAYNGGAEFLKNYVMKGQMVAVSGRLQIREWTDREGTKLRAYEVLCNNVYNVESRKRETLDDVADRAEAAGIGGYTAMEPADDGALPF